MSEVRVNNLSNENNTGGPTISGITTYSGRHFFVPPVGDTASRPSDCEPGSLRFNTDSAKLEYFRGNTIGWVEIEASDLSIFSSAVTPQFPLDDYQDVNEDVRLKHRFLDLRRPDVNQKLVKRSQITSKIRSVLDRA